MSLTEQQPVNRSDQTSPAVPFGPATEERSTPPARLRIAIDPTVEPCRSAMLAADTDVLTLAAVAANSRTPADVKALLVKNESALVRLYLAVQPDCPSEQLVALQGDPDADVAAAARAAMLRRGGGQDA